MEKTGVLASQERLCNALGVVGSSAFIAWTMVYLHIGVLAQRASASSLAISNIAAVIIIVIMFAAKLFLPKKYWRCGLVLFNAVLFAFWIVMLAAANFMPDNIIIYPLLSCARSFLMSSMLVSWATFYARSSLEHVGANLTRMAFLSLILFLISRLLNGSEPTVLLVLFYITISFAAFCVIAHSRKWRQATNKVSIPFSITMQSHAKNSFLFFGARILWGLCFGFLVTALSRLGDIEEYYSPIFIFAAILTLVLLLALTKYLQAPNEKKGRLPFPILAACPVIVASIMLFSSLGSGITSTMATIGLTLCFLLWNIQSFLQLGGYSILLNIDSLEISIREKLASGTGLAMGGICAIALPLPSIAPLWAACMILTYALVAYSTIAIINYLLRFLPQGQIKPKDPEGIPADERKQAIEEIAAEHGLTKREQEVFYLLAQGFSRPYIEKALFISSGTTKTHISHIYRKLGISNQDSAIELLANHQNTGHASDKKSR